MLFSSGTTNIAVPSIMYICREGYHSLSKDRNQVCVPHPGNTNEFPYLIHIVVLGILLNHNKSVDEQGASTLS